MSNIIRKTFHVDFADKQANLYEDDKKYISNNILHILINTAIASDINLKQLRLFYKPPPVREMRDPLGTKGHVGWTSSEGYNQGMDPELFKELENELQTDIRNQMIANAVCMWDNFIWDAFVWDGLTLLPAAAKLEGSQDPLGQRGLIDYEKNYGKTTTLSKDQQEIIQDFKWKNNWTGK
jgi:hypothetical protein